MLNNGSIVQPICTQDSIDVGDLTEEDSSSEEMDMRAELSMSMLSSETETAMTGFIPSVMSMIFGQVRDIFNPGLENASSMTSENEGNKLKAKGPPWLLCGNLCKSSLVSGKLL